MNRITSSLSIILLAALGFASCKKSTDTVVAPNTNPTTNSCSLTRVYTEADTANIIRFDNQNRVSSWNTLNNAEYFGDSTVLTAVNNNLEDYIIYYSNKQITKIHTVRLTAKLRTDVWSSLTYTSGKLSSYSNMSSTSPLNADGNPISTSTPVSTGGGSIAFPTANKMVLTITDNSTGTTKTTVVNCDLSGTKMPDTYRILNRRFLARISGLNFLVFTPELELYDNFLTNTSRKINDSTVASYIYESTGADSKGNYTGVTETGNTANDTRNYLFEYLCK